MNEPDDIRSAEAHEAEDSVTMSDEEIESRALDATPGASADDTDDSGDVADVGDDAGGDVGDDSADDSA